MDGQTAGVIVMLVSVISAAFPEPKPALLLFEETFAN